VVEVHVSGEVRAVERLVEDCAREEGFAALPIRDRLDRLARRLVRAHREGDGAVAVCVSCWHPRLTGAPKAEIMAAELDLADARETVAREYGFSSWAAVEQEGAAPPDEDFERAVDAVVHGDLERLRELLAARPELATRRSDYGHRATLLHYVGSNGVETHRQKVPANLARVARTLLEAGAEVDAPAEMYGGGTTTLALVVSSAHPGEAGVSDEVVRVLVDAGAARD
jgi:hypothetical protein